MKLSFLIPLLFNFITVAALADATSAVAPVISVKCVIQELVNGQNKTSELTLKYSEDPHGTLQNVKFETFPEVTGLVALVNDFVIISLYHQPTGIETASHSDYTGGKNAHLQLLMTSEKGIMIDCKAIK
jgi:hypothetical protein